MALENNIPTYTYVRYTGMQIAYGDNIYAIQDSHSNKKYLYWSITNPYTLEGVNVRKNQTVGTYLVIINDNGISTMPPQVDIAINFDGNNPGLIQDKIFGIYDTVDGYGDRFVAIETDIEGIKQIVGEGGTGGEDGNHNSIWEKISEIEQTAEKIDLSVKETNRVFAENKETLELRENLNKSIIDCNSNLGIFKSEISGYFKDNLINDEEKISIETHISILEASKSEVILHVDKVILIAENEGQTTITNSLKSAKNKFITSVDNLKTIINTAISDNTIVPSEITIIIDLFAKCNTSINELKNTCDEVIFLGAGGSISEELARIGIKSDEISLKVSKTEEKINTTLSIDKLALSGQITDIENAHSSLNNAMNIIFGNGEVSDSESIIIAEKIYELTREKTDIDNKYDSLYNSVHISESSKIALNIQYDIYVNKHNVTVSYINEAISDTFVNAAEINNISVHMNEYLSELSILHQKMNQSMDDIALNEQRAELQQAKDDLQGNISDVDNKVNDLNVYIDGTFSDNVLDSSERQAIKSNLDNLTREKTDIDNQYNQLINNRFLDGILKENYTTAYNNFIAKYNSLVDLINVILNKEDLINNSDRDNMNSKNIELNESIGVFIRLSNEVIEYIARKESEYVKGLLDKDITDVDNKVNDLTNDINSTFKDNVIDESERKAISLNLKDLELQKIDIDNQYNQLVLSTYLDGELKVEFVNKYNTLNLKYTELLDVMNEILNKEELITDIDRINLDNAKDLFGLAIGEYSTTVNKVIEYIGKKQSEGAVGDFNSQLGALNDKVDSILDDVGGALADDIIDETERIAIAQNLKELENEFAKNSSEYLKIYNNVNLVGNIKTQLNTIYKIYETKHNQLVETINYLINKVGLIDDADRIRLNNSHSEYKESLKNYVEISYDAIDSITNKGIEDAKDIFDKELGDLTNSLGNLEETMNGVFKDGVLSDAEKASIRQNLYTLELEKTDIDKSYNTIYNNTNLIGIHKVELKTSYDLYVDSYNNLVEVINDILNKAGIVDGTDKDKMDYAFSSHKTNLSNFKGKYNAAIDSITNKSVNDAKESLQKEISDLNNSLVDLEDTMNNAFKDGVLSDAEKLAIKQNLQTISNEKSDVDTQFLTVYGNADLIGDTKSNLKNAYDEYISKYNYLVSAINDILNKVGLIDSVDQTNLSNAFGEYRTASSVYSKRVNEAVDSIAQKKADDAESNSRKYTESEIKIVNDSISLKVSQTEYDSNNKIVEDKFSEIKQTTDNITSTVSDVKDIADDAHNRITVVDQSVSAINLKAESGKLNLLINSNGYEGLFGWHRGEGLEVRTVIDYPNEVSKGFHLVNGTSLVLELYSPNVYMTKDYKYTFQVHCSICESSVKTGFAVYIVDGNGNTTILLDDVKLGKHKVTYKATSSSNHKLLVLHKGSTQYSGSLIALQDFIISKGEYVSNLDWKPCTEDTANLSIKSNKIESSVKAVDDRLGTAESTITQQGNEIKSKVDENGVVSTMKQKAGEVIADFSQTGRVNIRNGNLAIQNSNGEDMFWTSGGRIVASGIDVYGVNDGTFNVFGNGSKGIELRSSNDNLCYLDFSRNDNADYHMRIALDRNEADLMGSFIAPQFEFKSQNDSIDYATFFKIVGHLTVTGSYPTPSVFALVDNGITEENGVITYDIGKSLNYLRTENILLNEENKVLKTEQVKQNEEIITNMVANTEVFEMVLSMMPMTMGSKEKSSGGDMAMVEVYATLIIKGVKTIDDVPLIIRAQVEQRLKDLEVSI